MTKVHRVVLLVVDHDGIGSASVADVIEAQTFANRCISPDVISVETVEVEWDDAHPLNLRATRDAEFARLFRPGEELVVTTACRPSR